MVNVLPLAIWNQRARRVVGKRLFEVLNRLNLPQRTRIGLQQIREARMVQKLELHESEVFLNGWPATNRLGRSARSCSTRSCRSISLPTLRSLGACERY